MARFADPGIGCWPKVLPILCLAGAIGATGQTRLSLLEFEERSAPEYVPTRLNQHVIIRGVVNAPALHFPSYEILGIQDERAGAIIRVGEGDGRLDVFRPGDYIEAEGTVSRFAGNVILSPTRLTKIGQRSAPEPVVVPVQALMNFRYLGMLVRTEGRIKETGENSAGALLVIGPSRDKYRLFVPHPSGKASANLDFVPGDKVRVTGVAFQYCTSPPYNTNFELLVREPASIVRLERGWLLSPGVLVSVLGGALLILFVLWKREHRMRAQRERLRRTYQLGEEILGASSADAILNRLAGALPQILGVSRVRLYVHNRAAKALDSITTGDETPVSISLAAPPGGPQAGAAACFHYRTVLVIPDIERSPFPMGAAPEGVPRSLLFVPMLAQGGVVGVLELDQDDRVRDFTADEQELAQHLGNQVGVAVRLLDQRTVQEQLFRTEKLAAVGRLISGVVNELQTPLASISDLAKRLLDKASSGPAEREVTTIAAEAQKAAAMVARLVSFAAAEQGEARPVPVNDLLRNLIEFREGDWKASGIKVRDLTTREPMHVLGSQGQLEQVFLNLLVHAEQALAEADVSQKRITIRTSVLARRLLVEISFSAPLESRTPEETAALLGVTRSVIAGHGGEVRLIEKNGNDPRFEIELPATAKERTPAAPVAVSGVRLESSRSVMTALVIEPDEAAQRQIVAALSTRGFRVVPVNNADTGLELAQRMRFDAAFCSVHAPGLNWVELSERMHSHIGVFVLVADGYDPELSADFEGEGRFVLPKPIQEGELDRVLGTLEPASTLKHGAA